MLNMDEAPHESCHQPVNENPGNKYSEELDRKDIPVKKELKIH